MKWRKGCPLQGPGVRIPLLLINTSLRNNLLSLFSHQRERLDYRSSRFPPVLTCHWSHFLFPLKAKGTLLQGATIPWFSAGFCTPTEKSFLCSEARACHSSCNVASDYYKKTARLPLSTGKRRQTVYWLLPLGTTQLHWNTHCMLINTVTICKHY